MEIHQPRYVDGNTGEETDQNIIIRVDFDQELLSCDPSFFHVIGLSLMKAYASEKSYFRTSCEVVLRSSFSGWKTLFLGKYSVSSLGGGWNDAEVRIDFLYQRNRPSVLLWDATPAGIHVYRRSLVCVFSHDVELVSVGVDGRGEVESINVGCENCLVVATNMLTKRLLTLELLANRRIGRSRHRSSRVDPSLVIQFVVPEGIAEDALGMGNVRSTPISESFDSKSFSLSLWSPLTPLTRNSSILFELLTSEPALPGEAGGLRGEEWLHLVADADAHRGSQHDDGRNDLPLSVPGEGDRPRPGLRGYPEECLFLPPLT